jgi:hypothetical protein
MTLIRLATKRSAISYFAFNFVVSAALAGSLSILCQPSVYAQKNVGTQKSSSKIEKNQTKGKATLSNKATASKKELDPATQKAIEQAAQKIDVDTRTSLNHLAEALHQEDKAINNELRDDEELSMTDIGMLWEAAVEHSGTIRYAIEKLSRRDATGKPADNDSFSKRIVQNLVHLGGVAGTMWSGTPAGLIGSNMVQNIMSGNPQDSALSRVTDADMVILAKEVEALQSNLITLYYNYRHAKERLTLTKEASSTIAKYYDHTIAIEGSTVEALQPLIQSIYDNAKQDEQSALHAFNSSRNALSLVVGPDAVAALEQETKTGNQNNSPIPVAFN